MGNDNIHISVKKEYNTNAVRLIVIKTNNTHPCYQVGL